MGNERFANYVMIFSLAWLTHTLCVPCCASILVRCFISIAGNARFSTYITIFVL